MVAAPRVGREPRPRVGERRRSEVERPRSSVATDVARVQCRHFRATGAGRGASEFISTELTGYQLEIG
jgi:hypothetical protein